MSRRWSYSLCLLRDYLQYIIQLFFTDLVCSQQSWEQHGTISGKTEEVAWWMDPLGRFLRVLNVLPREKIEGPPRDFLKARPNAKNPRGRRPWGFLAFGLAKEKTYFFAFVFSGIGLKPQNLWRGTKKVNGLVCKSFAFFCPAYSWNTFYNAYSI